MGETTMRTLITVELESAQPATSHPATRRESLGRPDLLALPEGLSDLPEWLRLPLSRFLRLKQRNWPAKTVQRSTRHLFSRLNHISTYFIQNYGWNDWPQLSPRWVEDYIDARLREGKAPATINVDLGFLRSFCRFLIDEGYAVSDAILRMKRLDTPHRLPRPVSEEQVRRLECCIQSAVAEAQMDRQWLLAVRDLACFYLLWHCGMRISEVCSLLVNDIDIEARKIFIRNSKERKDRMVYISDTAAMALQQHLAIRYDPDAVHVFPTGRGVMTPRTLQRRLVHYGGLCDVPITAHRLRHTFASQMLAAGMPVTSLQRYLGHKHLDTTMIYAEVSDPLLKQDYYMGIAALDPTSAQTESPQQVEFRQLVQELKTAKLGQKRQDEILERMQRLLASISVDDK
ncbi:MAG: tyrosine-type recombinase/integrase [Anaerolineales bacterium]|nr:tyrosine-type recombinase/integrase [Anaerolineales bacterium]